MAVLVTVLLQLGKGGGAVRVVIHIQDAILLSVKRHVHHYRGAAIYSTTEKLDFRTALNGTHFSVIRRGKMIAIFFHARSGGANP